MKLIVGLGNPGEKYIGSRHNVGFDTVNFLCDRWVGEWKLNKKLKVMMARTSNIKNQKSNKAEEIWLLKPQTYMNESGNAVRNFVDFYKLETINSKLETWLIHDDVDLELGRLKIQMGGGAAGHHGVESVIRQVSSFQFPVSSLVRFRLGIGKPKILNNESAYLPARQGIMNYDSDKEMENWVLSRFTKMERQKADEMVERCVEAVECALSDGVDKAMNRFNIL